ncbi:YeeE/YedE thiosulfate transporter family protein [Caldovatus aquaticus]|uniref:YeeE/YedE family protein n=1 Tax=Caldovatus aquaticus TaxID=2865671 RepID=A0ABS7F411_9PROT|nr:YeeE/YedE thiosulfate transporter family protein [Caldovatus aquaticus]MBW8270028.1 YeeE/YedE family protein [Caldovatus aquaticus]
MSVFSAVLLGLAMGVVFGFLLEKSRVFEPAVIVGQFQLRNFLMLRVFLAGVAAGLVVLAVLTGFGWAKLAPKATLPVADLVGGLVLGAGIALAGACPGTVLVQIGAGYRDAWFTLAGGLLGAVTFIYAEPALAPWLAAGGQGKLTLDVVLGVPFWPLALAVAVPLSLVLWTMERWRPWRTELGDAADGLLPPAAGAASPHAGRALPAE